MTLINTRDKIDLLGKLKNLPEGHYSTIRPSVGLTVNTKNNVHHQIKNLISSVKKPPRNSRLDIVNAIIDPCNIFDNIVKI